MICPIVLASPFIEWLKDAAVVVGFILSVISLVVFVVKPIQKLVKEYKEALAKAKEQLSTQNTLIESIIETNKQQSECIKAIKEDRATLYSDVKLIKNAITTLLKVELDRECIKALSAGSISEIELKSLTDLSDIYENFSGNGHSRLSTINQVKKLPINR